MVNFSPETLQCLFLNERIVSFFLSFCLYTQSSLSRYFTLILEVLVSASVLRSSLVLGMSVCTRADVSARSFLGAIFSMLVLGIACLLKRMLADTGLSTSRILELVSSVSDGLVKKRHYGLASCNLFSKERQAP